MISRIPSSKTPCVEGYVTIKAASLSLCSVAFSLRSSRSIFPYSSHLIITTFIPAITALAGFVPCADDGIRQIFLCSSPLLLKYSRIIINPVYSPAAPELGWNEIAEKPVISQKSFSSWFINSV